MGTGKLKLAILLWSTAVAWGAVQSRTSKRRLRLTAVSYPEDYSLPSQEEVIVTATEEEEHDTSTGPQTHPDLPILQANHHIDSNEEPDTTGLLTVEATQFGELTHPDNAVVVEASQLGPSTHPDDLPVVDPSFFGGSSHLDDPAATNATGETGTQTHPDLPVLDVASPPPSPGSHDGSQTHPDLPVLELASPPPSLGEHLGLQTHPDLPVLDIASPPPSPGLHVGPQTHPDLPVLDMASPAPSPAVHVGPQSHPDLPVLGPGGHPYGIAPQQPAPAPKPYGQAPQHVVHHIPGAPTSEPLLEAEKTQSSPGSEEATSRTSTSWIVSLTILFVGVPLVLWIRKQSKRRARQPNYGHFGFSAGKPAPNAYGFARKPTPPPSAFVNLAPAQDSFSIT